jgi:two-component system response regulator NreC
MPKIRLLLVDDHQVVRAGLRMLFQAEKDMEIVGEVGSGEEALKAVHELKPDVVLMDVVMSGMSGIEATRRIKEVSPDTAVLALTMHEDEQYFFEMLQAGASGYIPKRAAPDDLVSATPREREVLTYIAEGYTNREIAEALVISIKTVDRHRENIMNKLSLHNRVELVKYAIEKGLITVS